MTYHIKYRPSTLATVFGQPLAVKQLQGFLDASSVPQVIGFYGPPGTGKTTLARIMAKEVGATFLSVQEINVADKNGVEDVRKLRDDAAMKPLGSKVSVFILDEAHSFSKQAFQGLLKLFEDTPKHCYFFLCTSQPEKIDKAIKTRITGIELKAVLEAELVKLIKNVATCESLGDRGGDFAAIAKAAKGSARNALVYLNQLQACGFDRSVLADLANSVDEKHNAFPLCAALMWPKNVKWGDVYALVDGIEDEELEAVRWMLLRYAASCMKDTKHCGAARTLIEGMFVPFFDSKKPGFLAKCSVIWTKNGV